MTATAASGSWCPPSRPTSGSAKWRSCSTSSTTSSTCSSPSRRTRRCSGSSSSSSSNRRPRCTRPAARRGLPGPRSRRSTRTRLLPLISKGTVFCAAELHFQGVQQADPEPEKQKERHIRKGGGGREKISATGQKEKKKKSFNFSRLLLVSERGFFHNLLCTFKNILHTHLSLFCLFVRSVRLKSDVNCILVFSMCGSSVGRKIKSKLGVLEV